MVCGGSETHLRKNGSRICDEQAHHRHAPGGRSCCGDYPVELSGGDDHEKSGAALAAGCTFIIKPAPDTPLTALELVRLGHEAGIPKDVLQCVIGDGKEIGSIFTSHPLIRKLRSPDLRLSANI